MDGTAKHVIVKVLLPGVSLMVSCGILARLPGWNLVCGLAGLLFLLGYYPLSAAFPEPKSVPVRITFSVLSVVLLAAGVYCVYADNGGERGIVSGTMFLMESMLIQADSGATGKRAKTVLRLVALFMIALGIYMWFAFEDTERNFTTGTILALFGYVMFRIVK
ncbi:MAG: hypothetical protein IKO14_09280 [Oscillibacter sp.]|nr:hypothetical protein [Oscillibacter sp.]